MMHIGLDFDDTLLDTRRVFLAILNRIHGTTHETEMLQDYSLMIPFQCTSDYLEGIFSQHFAELHDLAPLPGVLATLQRAVARGHRLTVITARPAVHMPPLHTWLARHGIQAERAISAPQSGEKALRAAEANVDVFVDDNPRHTLAIAGRGIRVLLLDRPYNRMCQGAHIRRVLDWNEIGEILLPSDGEAMYSRDGCWPNASSSLIFTKGIGFRATD